MESQTIIIQGGYPSIVLYRYFSVFSLSNFLSYSIFTLQFKTHDNIYNPLNSYLSKSCVYLIRSCKALTTLTVCLSYKLPQFRVTWTTFQLCLPIKFFRYFSFAIGSWKDRRDLVLYEQMDLQTYGAPYFLYSCRALLVQVATA